MDGIFLVPFPGSGKPFRSLRLMEGDSIVVSKSVHTHDHLTDSSVNMKIRSTVPGACMQNLLGHYDISSHFPLYLGLSSFSCSFV